MSIKLVQGLRGRMIAAIGSAVLGGLALLTLVVTLQVTRSARRDALDRARSESALGAAQAAATLGRAQQAAKSLAQVLEGRPSVLLVDDEDLVREMIRIFLTSRGHAVFSASDGREALRHLARETVDLIITDLCMPDSECVELIMVLRRRARRLPVIAISGGLDGDAPGLLKAASLLGAERTLAKPFPLGELAAAIDDGSGWPAGAG